MPKSRTVMTDAVCASGPKGRFPAARNTLWPWSRVRTTALRERMRTHGEDRTEVERSQGVEEQQTGIDHGEAVPRRNGAKGGVADSL